MNEITQQDLLKARVHLGHITKKWDPNMAPFIFNEKNGIHIIDLKKTIEGLKKATEAIKNIVQTGKKVMFVATKKQASSIIEETAKKLKQPYMTERWLGGTLTNFSTIRKSLKKLSNIHKIKKSITYQNLAKREKLTIQREQAKLEKILKGISDLNRIPAAMFIIDIKNEAIAVKEAKKLGIPIFAMVDSNSNPNLVDYPIPSNDDSSASIAKIVTVIAKAIEEGLEKRKLDKGTTSHNNKESKKDFSKTNNSVSSSDKNINKSEKKVSSSDNIKTKKIIKANPLIKKNTNTIDKSKIKTDKIETKEKKISDKSTNKK